jgi:hypothetical protein
MLAPGIIRANSSNFVISDMSFEVLRILSIAAEGILRANGEREDGAEVVFVLRGLARLGGVMARVVRSRCDLVYENLT